MKKILTLILFIISVFTISTSVFAVENELQLTFSNEARYEINIPSSVSFDVSSGVADIRFAVFDEVLGDNMYISLGLESDNYDDSWNLVSDSGAKIPYTIDAIGLKNDLASGDRILYTDEAKNIHLSAVVKNFNLSSMAGIYYDTLTFTSEVETLIPGLYDENDNLIITYENAGLDVESDYNGNSCYSKGNVLYEVDVNYTNAVKLVLPDGITRIGEYAIGSAAIKELIIPSSVTEIGAWAMNSLGVESLVLPNGLSDIGPYTFIGSFLKTITIPDGVQQLESGIFAVSSTLEDIVLSPYNKVIYDIFYYSGAEEEINQNIVNIYVLGYQSEWDAVTKSSNWTDGVAGVNVIVNYRYE